jgi:hypothetical protein
MAFRDAVTGDPADLIGDDSCDIDGFGAAKKGVPHTAGRVAPARANRQGG